MINIFIVLNILLMAPRMVYCMYDEYNQIILPKSEPTHMTPVREQGP